MVPRSVDGERGIAQVLESGYVDGLRLHYNLATLYMETVFKSSLGVQMDSFLREYGARLKNKHILYAVSTNLAEDREISRSTRGRLGGVNIKIGKSTGNPYARLKAYTNMASNYKAQFPQSGVRVLFVRTYPKRKESQSGKPIVEVVETLLKRALRADNRKVPRRGEEIFNIDPQELFGLIETLGTEEYQYDERRSSERLGKRLLWVITDTVTGTMKLMFAEDYDSVLKKFAESTDPNLLDDRTRLLTRYYIRPVTRNFPGNVSGPSRLKCLKSRRSRCRKCRPIRRRFGSREGLASDRGTRTMFSPRLRLSDEARRFRLEAVLVFYQGRTCLKRLPHRGDDRPRRSCETRNRTTWISRGRPCSVSI